MIEIKADIQTLEAQFKQLAARTNHTKPAMAAIAEIMVRSSHTWG